MNAVECGAIIRDGATLCRCAPRSGYFSGFRPSSKVGTSSLMVG
jgi:hypothetical protein